MLDLLITNGYILDGTGSPGYYGSVGVEGDTIRIFRGSTAEVETGRTIDATDHVVSPGFIDMHSHAGLVILSEPEHHPKVRQGITTELIGVDGNSYAPFRSHDDFLSFVELHSGLAFAVLSGGTRELQIARAFAHCRRELDPVSDDGLHRERTVVECGLLRALLERLDHQHAPVRAAQPVQIGDLEGPPNLSDALRRDHELLGRELDPRAVRAFL